LLKKQGCPIRNWTTLFSRSGYFEVSQSSPVRFGLQALYDFGFTGWVFSGFVGLARKSGSRVGLLFGVCWRKGGNSGRRVGISGILINGLGVAGGCEMAVGGMGVAVGD
jgi:hypothetical protein